MERINRSTTKDKEVKNKISSQMKVALTIFLFLGGPIAKAQAVPTIAGCNAANFIDGGINSQVGTLGKSYSPKCLRVKVGSTVSIQASSHHPLSAMPDINGVQNPFSNGTSFSTSQTRVMSNPGLFGYFCEAHGDAEGDGMAGVILVEL
jgi:plastocyanin